MNLAARGSPAIKLFQSNFEWATYRQVCLNGTLPISIKPSWNEAYKEFANESISQETRAELIFFSAAHRDPCARRTSQTVRVVVPGWRSKALQRPILKQVYFTICPFGLCSPVQCLLPNKNALIRDVSANGGQRLSKAAHSIKEYSAASQRKWFLGIPSLLLQIFCDTT